MGTQRIVPCDTGVACVGLSFAGERFTWRGEKDSLAEVIECTPVHSTTFLPLDENLHVLDFYR